MQLGAYFAFQHLFNDVCVSTEDHGHGGLISQRRACVDVFWWSPHFVFPCNPPQIQCAAAGDDERKKERKAEASGDRSDLGRNNEIEKLTALGDEQKLRVPELGNGIATELVVPELELPQATLVPILNIWELPSAIPVPILIFYGTANCRVYK
ncbi:hypothetical protein LXL04_007973 [Taraxacum kok-saghyz]